MYPKVEGSFEAMPTFCMTIQSHNPDFHNINLHTAVETSHLIQRQTKQSDIYLHIPLRITDSLSAAMVLKESSNDPEEDDEQGTVDGKNTAHTCFSQIPADNIVCVFATAASHMNCWQRR